MPNAVANPTRSSSQTALADVLGAYTTESGQTLLGLTEGSPVLLVFLRHFGCSFCRETLDRIAQVQGQLEARGVRPVFVHLATPERARPYFDYYKLTDVERVSDPDASLYQNPVFGLGRTNPVSHFFRPAVVKAWLTGAIRSYGFGLIKEDAGQMPGVFFLRDGKIANFYRYRTIADRPDYLALVG
jgi:peroxiredoxin